VDILCRMSRIEKAAPLKSTRVRHPIELGRLLGVGGGGGLGGGLGGAQGDGEALAVGIDGGEGVGAVGLRVGGVGVFGVASGLINDVSREGGNGLLVAENGDLDVGSGAVPDDGVFAGVEGLAFDGDFVGEIESGFVGIVGECGGREQQRSTEKRERKFREFHVQLL